MKEQNKTILFTGLLRNEKGNDIRGGLQLHILKYILCINSFWTTAISGDKFQLSRIKGAIKNDKRIIFGSVYTR